MPESADAEYVLPHVRSTITSAMRRAGHPRTVDGIDGIETHDCFTTSEYMAIDHFGITQPGESWKAVEEGWLEIDGKMPINPSGGLIGAGHPVGATGVRQLLDAHKQVTGDRPATTRSTAPRTSRRSTSAEAVPPASVSSSASIRPGTTLVRRHGFRRRPLRP